MKINMMKCGHSANAVNGKGKPFCAICEGWLKWKEGDEPPEIAIRRLRGDEIIGKIIITNGELDLTEKQPFELVDERDSLRAELVHLHEQFNTVCHWEYNDDGFWITYCSGAFCFEYGGIKENGYIFCPKCGRKIEEVIAEEAIETFVGDSDHEHDDRIL